MAQMEVLDSTGPQGQLADDKCMVSTSLRYLTSRLCFLEDTEGAVRKGNSRPSVVVAGVWVFLCMVAGWVAGETGPFFFRSVTKHEWLSMDGPKSRLGSSYECTNETDFIFARPQSVSLLFRATRHENSRPTCVGLHGTASAGRKAEDGEALRNNIQKVLQREHRRPLVSQSVCDCMLERTYHRFERSPP
jgi:hypothetical protein